ncbi:MAG TPA: M50 family metallopeptidase [Solirubrobacteraceae bacterium]|jgi:regulator of sigma E protease|nr:M50 family metallopeptidase [Solirubrobacteraceae bacterium]
MSYVLTFVGFAALIILHEAGHFVAAKAVGMRVERFSLFFGRTRLRFQRGETEYGIGWIPLGGFVKITGMSPYEELTPDVAPRAYINQPPWKRIVVILAGPFVNVVIAFVILFVIYLSVPQDTSRHGQLVTKGVAVAATTAPPASQYLKPNDRIVTVDGRPITNYQQVTTLVSSDRCRGAQVSGCLAATPVRVTVRRHGKLVSFSLYPRYNAKAKRMLIGFEIGEIPVTHNLGAIDAAHQGIDEMWTVTSETVSHIAQLFKSQDRRQLHSIVGVAEIVQQSFSYDTTEAFWILGLISLSLAIVNLFPFLPLDGGHVFWAVAEKVRGRRIPFSVMERAGVVGFLLIIALFVVGLSNDLSGTGLHVPH